MMFTEVSAQVATFTTQQYPLLGNTHIAADFNGDSRPDLAGAGANAVSVMLGNGDGTFRAKTDFPVGTRCWCRREWRNTRARCDDYDGATILAARCFRETIGTERHS